ncbi:MAG: winged helix-turn-helix transcriptional regulator [Methanobacteriota archaeon]|nr:MAG: winged helix-turn-helix transcriptional regulator [Euryarchaeota archaeon]
MRGALVIVLAKRAQGADASDGPRGLAAVSVLADAYALRILNALNSEPKTASELVRSASLPPAACYRRLRALEAAGLISQAGSVATRGGKPAQRYQANVSAVHVLYDAGRLEVRLDLRDGGSRETVLSLPEETPPAKRASKGLTGAADIQS